MSVEQLSEEQIAEFKEAFSTLEIKDEGTILSKDLREVMRLLGEHPTEADLQRFIKKFENDGVIDFLDFLTIMAEKRRECPGDEELREAFRLFDRAGNGFVSSAELRHVMVNLGDKLTEQEVDDLIMEADVNGDGHIDYGGFVEKILKI